MKKFRAHTTTIAIIIGASLLLIVAWSSLTMAAPPALPPRPIPTATVTPTPTPGPPPIFSPPRGGYIVLYAPSASFEMWTLVQWQDGFGQWHDVEGWQGTFDKLINGTGQKLWWVAGENLGQGPFRWIVYQRQGESRLTISEPFHLPAVQGDVVTVEVSLEP